MKPRRPIIEVDTNVVANLIPPHPATSHPILPRPIISSHPSPPHLTPLRGIPFHRIPPHPTPSHPTPSHLTPSHPIPPHPNPPHPIPSHPPTPRQAARGPGWTKIVASAAKARHKQKSGVFDVLGSTPQTRWPQGYSGVRHSRRREGPSTPSTRTFEAGASSARPRLRSRVPRHLLFVIS